MKSPLNDSGRFKLIIPPLAVGANKVMCDLFNASSLTLTVRSVCATPNLDTAVVGALGVRYSLTRTTTVGTGGTAATVNGVNPVAPVISSLSGTDALPTGITARSAPTGGATAGAVLGTRQVFTEETSAASIDKSYSALDEVCVIPPNTGIRFVQGTEAGLGSVGFEVVVGV